MLEKISLQINLTRADLGVLYWLLPRQLDYFAGCCGDILLVLDEPLDAPNFPVSLRKAESLALEDLLEKMQNSYPHLRLLRLNEGFSSEIPDPFFGSAIPHRDFRGGPFRAYFEGLAQTESEWVLHLDADMILGGEVQDWLETALEILKQDQQIIGCCPLAGPPRADGSVAQFYVAPYAQPDGFCYSAWTSRIFLTQKSRFYKALKLEYLNSEGTDQKIVLPGVLLAETIITQWMRANELLRLEFSGGFPGLWSLHPEPKDLAFYQALPLLLKAIDSAQIPEFQKGRFNLEKAWVESLLA
ncbi:hypothetical protein COW36_22610 [bacterium (Candidatus Blackallbacteria) CG17_big_fil_post_rev_8_21_14_2_50_48_46]|uniref:Glycosyltransferase 2-like domain-containing protein n=1 Tax=bacterium (Candidatus Blackallbacteria) CG17_big_fil_post_rev_8_21_14_2_50_48_46 TaxID=2014261 RepID=A0A2M7FXY1_9BACT|nr:MAG: hypothetical protein COW64_07380 [bacterium (Candidatus Blackallbacteria) CG18_big_fil_WC_8_21_14_2_50_49_26]PIW14171.1 MAG: hypothetical protein COW36_22610 [bacterium (Candidatus Blackallbacteria) CG17_big_fil_post_rev_8_21_14_2_50_48_46]PIW46712.1 MAG: hypothetical protein COW20_14885 [bacterium (Candidatus Blackallbacteria) CG13_big_fil_rev_8_21_14_2_50_49_14]